MPWEVMPDLFFYRDPEEAEKEEAAREEAAAISKQVGGLLVFCIRHRDDTTELGNAV